MERKTRFELATLALARRCSTPEPLPHIWSREMDSNHRRRSQRIYSPPPLATRESLDIIRAQNIVAQTFQIFNAFFWSWRRESNPQPADYKSAALPLSHASRINLATWNGLEPSTSSVTGWHSNQLNYLAKSFAVAAFARHCGVRWWAL